MQTDFSNISGIYKTNTHIINRAISDVSAVDWFRNPGADSNHLMWLLGHVIIHRGYVLKMLGVDWDKPWSSLFARGATRVADAEYPTIEEVRASWAQISEQLSAALREPSAELLSQPAPQGPLSFDKKVSGSIAFLALHDTYHAGQLSYLHKWLGYGQTVG